MWNNLEPFATVPLMEKLNEKKVAEEQSWYQHDSIAAPLFGDREPQRVQLPLANSVTLASVELHYLRRSDCNRQPPTPLISETPAFSPTES